jgi:hypothetical protein
MYVVKDAFELLNCDDRIGHWTILWKFGSSEPLKKLRNLSLSLSRS